MDENGRVRSTKVSAYFLIKNLSLAHSEAKYLGATEPPPWLLQRPHAGFIRTLSFSTLGRKLTICLQNPKKSKCLEKNGGFYQPVNLSYSRLARISLLIINDHHHQ